MLEKLLTGYITGKCGSAVAEQFQDTFSAGYVGDQNHNAIKWIYDELNPISEDPAFSESAQLEVKEYLEELKEYLG